MLGVRPSISPSVLSALTHFLGSKLKISHRSHSIDVQNKGLNQVQIWMTLKSERFSLFYYGKYLCMVVI